MKLDEGIKRRVSETTLEELSAVFSKAVKEAYQAGKASIVEDKQDSVLKLKDLIVGDKVEFIGKIGQFNECVTTGRLYTITEIDGDGDAIFNDDKAISYISSSTAHMFKKIESPQFKTVKRNAKVGERILIMKSLYSKLDSVGKVYTVTRVNDVGSVDVKELVKFPNEWDFVDTEYEVIIEEPVPIKSANQQRKELNQRAREFVENVMDGDGDVTFRSHEKLPICTPEFIVNTKNRMVTVLLRGYNTGKLYAKGIAKCMPGDVFNEWIGKAIALARALEIDIPEEFTDAVQPTELVVGQITERKGDGTLFEITGLDKHKAYTNPGASWYREFSDNKSLKGIIDDTNAIY